MTFLGSVLIGFGLWIVGFCFFGMRRPTALELRKGQREESSSTTNETFSRIQGELIRRLIPESRITKVSENISRAGQPDEYSLEKVLTLKIFGAFILGFLGVLYFIQQPNAFRAVAMLFGVIAGFVLPEMVVSNRADARRREVQAGLPDAIDQLSVTVRAGLSVDAALVRVSTTLRGPIADELSRVVQDIQLGIARTDALKSMADRMDIQELSQFVRALVQADSLGIPVANTLSSQAEEMRLKRRERAEEQAQKLPVKILAPMTVCILPSLLIIVLGPPLIQIARNL